MPISPTLKILFGIVGFGGVLGGGYEIYKTTKGETVKEILSKKYDVFETSGDSNYGEWLLLISKYAGTLTLDNEPQKIEGLELTFSLENDLFSHKSSVSNLQSKCSELLMSNYDGENSRNYIDAKNWCTDSQLNGKYNEKSDTK